MIIFFLASVDENNDGIADRVDEDGMFDPMGELLLTDYENEDVEIYGFEAEIAARLMDTKQYALDGRVFYDQVRIEERSSGGNIPRVPPRRVGVDLDFDRGPWGADAQAIFVAKQNHAADLEDETSSYTMVNAGIDYTLKYSDAEIKLFLRGENLLDEDARKHTSFNAETRTSTGYRSEIWCVCKILRMNYVDIAKDNEGYLLDPTEWEESLALQIAEVETIQMTEDHWIVVKFVREYFEKNQSVPELRKVLKHLKESHGKEKATRKHVYSLFPYGYGQQACKIAGMRKPLKLMLDV